MIMCMHDYRVSSNPPRIIFSCMVDDCRLTCKWTAWTVRPRGPFFTCQTSDVLAATRRPHDMSSDCAGEQCSAESRKECLTLGPMALLAALWMRSSFRLATSVHAGEIITRTPFAGDSESECGQTMVTPTPHSTSKTPHSQVPIDVIYNSSESHDPFFS